MNTTKTQNAIELLKADHQVVADLLEKIAATTERAAATREELFAKLKMNLDTHAHIEETFFYPAIKEAEETREITLEAYEEHAVVKDLLVQLAEEDHQAEEWTAKFTVLKENIEHHVKEEEGDMFPKVKKILGEEMLVELGEKMRMEKEKFMAKQK